MKTSSEEAERQDRGRDQDKTHSGTSSTSSKTFSIWEVSRREENKEAALQMEREKTFL